MICSGRAQFIQYNRRLNLQQYESYYSIEKTLHIFFFSFRCHHSQQPKETRVLAAYSLIPFNRFLMKRICHLSCFYVIFSAPLIFILQCNIFFLLRIIAVLLFASSARYRQPLPWTNSETRKFHESSQRQRWTRATTTMVTIFDIYMPISN